MSYHHVAHMKSFEVGLHEGIVVKRGDVLGRLGHTGTSSPHCHYEVAVSRPKKWTEYVWGLTKAEVANKYADPAKWIDKKLHIPAPFDRYTGYAYLQKIQGANGYHPGVDINAGNSGWADEGMLIKAPCDGTLVYVGTDPGKTGWGNHLWIKESKTEDLMQQFDNRLIQETEESGSFALVYGGEKHIISKDRAGLAALTVSARKMEYSDLSKSQWNSIQTGKDF